MYCGYCWVAFEQGDFMVRIIEYDTKLKTLRAECDNAIIDDIPFSKCKSVRGMGFPWEEED